MRGYWNRIAVGIILLVVAGGLLRQVNRAERAPTSASTAGTWSLAAVPVMRAAAPGATWQPQIAVVWPHDGAGHGVPVTQARAVNVSIWPRNFVACSVVPMSLRLYMARNNSPARAVGVNGVLVMRTVNGVTFPTLEFNDIPVDNATDPTVQYRFYADGGSGPMMPEQASQRFSNLWVHAADARTVQPQPIRPVGFAQGAAGQAYDAWVQIVYPHDAQGQPVPAEVAPLVNIAVDLFERTNQAPYRSVPYEAMPTLDLLIAEGNSPFRSTGVAGMKEGYPLGDAPSPLVPRAVFNDVTVQPGRGTQFMVMERQGTTLSSVWTHAADARTFLPEPTVPPPCSGAPATPIPPSPTVPPAPTVPLPATATPLPPPQSDFERLLGEMLNQARTENGLPTLSVQPELNQAARRHNLDMAINQITSHTGSDGSTPSQRIREAGYQWVRSGEIIGWGFTQPAAMMNWWINHPPHRVVILSDAYADFGISYVFDATSPWKHYWTVDFGRRVGTNTAEQEDLYTCTYESEGPEGGSRVTYYSEEPCP